jgi:hypothetical protein
MRDRYGSTIGVRARASTAFASGVWSLREHMQDSGSGSWPIYDPVAATVPIIYYDFSDPTSLRINGGTVAPTSANNNSSVTPQDKSLNALHLITYNGLPQWSLGLQNGRSGGVWNVNSGLYRGSVPQLANHHRGQSTTVFVFWPGATGTNPADGNQTIFSTTGLQVPSYSSYGFQINYINSPAFGLSSTISYISANNGTAAAVFAAPNNVVTKNRFSIITVVTDVGNAIANERVKIYVDGGASSYSGNLSTAAPYSFASGSLFLVGSGSTTSMRMGQALFYDSILPASTLNTIHACLGEYWAIPVTSF